MTTTTLMGNWGLLREKLRQKYAQLTENDLAYVKDREEEVLSHIQAKTGATRAELEGYLQEAAPESAAT